MSPRAGVFILTGSFSVGKTSVLHRLRDHYAIRVHEEAHAAVLRDLGWRTAGHPMNSGFTRIESPDHLCPWCRPREFLALVLQKQAEIESAAMEGDFIERGYVDAIHYFGSTTGDVNSLGTPDLSSVGNYRGVFLLEVMPELQIAKWDKSAEERVAACLNINARLHEMYIEAGYRVFRIRRGTVAERAALVLEIAERLEPTNRLTGEST